MCRVLFICRANIFRSPLAEGILKALLNQENRLDTWSVHSAGTWVKHEQSVHPWVREVLAEKGVDTGLYEPREVSEEMVSMADVVLTMESGQAEALQAEFPAQADKVYMLSELKGEVREIPDPVGGREEDFRETVELIEYYLKGSEQRLKELVR